MESTPTNPLKPNLKDRLFWNWKLDEMDWKKSARAVIERVLVRGNDEEYEEMIRFYGRERVLHVMTEERCSIPNFMIDSVVGYFGLKKEELSCYRWRLQSGYGWI